MAYDKFWKRTKSSFQSLLCLCQKVRGAPRSSRSVPRPLGNTLCVPRTRKHNPLRGASALRSIFGSLGIPLLLLSQKYCVCNFLFCLAAIDNGMQICVSGCMQKTNDLPPKLRRTAVSHLLGSENIPLPFVILSKSMNVHQPVIQKSSAMLVLAEKDRRAGRQVSPCLPAN